MLNTTRLRRALSNYEAVRGCTPKASDAKHVRVRIEDYGDVSISEATRRMICEEVAVLSAVALAEAEQEIIAACKELSNAS